MSVARVVSPHRRGIRSGSAGDDATSLDRRLSNRLHPPPTPTLIFPVPRHVGQTFEASRPLPPQSGHTVSPVPGVPMGAWSPGAIGGAGLIGSPEASIGMDEKNIMGCLL